MSKLRNHEIARDSEDHVERLPPVERFVYRLMRPVRAFFAVTSRMDESGWFSRSWEATSLQAFGKAILTFTTAWFSSRRYKTLVYAAPALALIVPVGMAVVIAARSGSPGYHYHGAAQTAWRDGDTPTALLLFEKACQLRPEDRQLRYERALCTAEGGDLESAIQQMENLADLDSERPRRWLASVYFQNLNQSDHPRLDLVVRLERHVTALLASNSQDMTALKMRVVCLQRNGQTSDAIRLLEETPNRPPEMSLALAELHLEKRRPGTSTNDRRNSHCRFSSTVRIGRVDQPA